MKQNTFAVRIETLGCRLNQTESEGLAFIFSNLGFSIFSLEKNTDIESAKDVFLCIVNTCTVTSKAEQKARRLIRLLLKKHINSIVLVTGCYAELEKEKIEALDERVLAFSGKKKDILSMLPKYIKTNFEKYEAYNQIVWKNLKTSLISFREQYENNIKEYTLNFTPLPPFALSSPTFMFHSRATLKIQDGCNNSCTFCRIRLARGKSSSLSAKEAIKRLKEIEEMGSSEVVITGVNLSQYSSEGLNFAHLLYALLNESSKIHIRISSLYPESITDELLSVIKDKRICPHFHLSIQSGSDYILQKMGRRYSRADIYRAVENIRKVKEEPFIGCDIIAGFPQETEEYFEETFSMCKELNFAGIHAFPFSPRPGTLAFDMKQKVSEHISCQRVSRLTTLATKNYEEYLAKCNGKCFFAICESKNDDSEFVTSENYLHLPLKSQKKHIAGEAINIKLISNFALEI